MTSARTLHCGYFIDLEQDIQGWLVRTITHSLTGRPLLPPGFRYPDRATAELYAQAAIDGQLRGGLRPNM